MNTKNWWQSKAVIAGIILMGLGVAHYFKSGNLTEAMIIVTNGLGLIGIRTAQTTVK